MHKEGWFIASTIGLIGAVIVHMRKRARVASPALTLSPGGAILADLPDHPPNLLYLTKPPWLLVGVHTFRADGKDFPKPHRYRDPQGPLAAVYDPTQKGLK